LDGKNAKLWTKFCIQEQTIWYRTTASVKLILVDKYMPQPHTLRSGAGFSWKFISRLWTLLK
jgi:hypothetical protein